jgi:predicted dehydrogenase
MNQPDSSEADFNRRDFLKGSSLAALMTMMGGVRLMAQSAPAQKVSTLGPKPKVKVAVIGLGAWGRELLDQLGRLEQAEVVAICDNYPAMVRRSASKAPGAAPVENYEEILANKEIKAVIVATGSHQHKDIVIAALKAGKHVYCEAPLAHTVEDARAIALAAKEAVAHVFQPGLQGRSDPQRHFLYPFIRSGALGKTVMARSQWHKKQSWRQASPNSEREQAINWRLQKATSPGLIGEIGIHALDQAGWLLNLTPVAVTGFGSTMLWKDDGRDVPDTVEAVLEFPGGVRMNYNASLATSFDSEYELLYGTDATIMMRQDAKGNQMAWMFKEVDSALLGWEVYARKDNFYKETGIALVLDGSKQQSYSEGAAGGGAAELPQHYYALQAFLANCHEVSAEVADFQANYGSDDKQALADHLATIVRGREQSRQTAGYQEGYAATVIALKVNEAVNTGKRIEFQKEWFELA